MRMGLHTGLSTPVDRDSLRPTGQPGRPRDERHERRSDRVSSATVALCRDSAFRDAGHHVLAGVGDEQLFVVVGVGSSEDRPLRTAAACPPTCPSPCGPSAGTRSSTAGRRHRRVAGGHTARAGWVGKTRLAHEAARDVAAGSPAGCGCASWRSSSTATRWRPPWRSPRPPKPGRQDLTQAVVAYLQRRRCLLVLDNCEHVVDGVVELARRPSRWRAPRCSPPPRGPRGGRRAVVAGAAAGGGSGGGAVRRSLPSPRPEFRRRRRHRGGDPGDQPPR